MDGFHHPRARRHRQGRLSADGYYEDAYDFDALIANVLAPLGPGGSGRYRDSIIDLASDQATDAPPKTAPVDAILVVDGTFLHREPVQHHGTTPGYWDRTVFVDTDFDTARTRGIERDRDLLGGPAKAAEAFDLRYHAASRRYLDEVDPRALASFVVDTALGAVIE
jgi:uridine kinase